MDFKDGRCATVRVQQRYLASVRFYSIDPVVRSLWLVTSFQQLKITEEQQPKIRNTGIRNFFDLNIRLAYNDLIIIIFNEYIFKYPSVDK